MVVSLQNQSNIYIIMKTTKKILMVALVAILSATATNAQSYEWQKPVQKGEKELELVLDTVNAGCYTWWGWPNKSDEDERRNYTTEQIYKHLFDKVKALYGDTHPGFALRQFSWKKEVSGRYSDGYNPGDRGFKTEYYSIYSSAIIVIPDAPKPVENPLSKAIDKALMEVREGTRIALDQIRVPTGTDKEEYKDQVVELLLDKGFKVVAKEYLEKLYEEQQQQQSGIYNDRTTVQENNFSAVGYYLNVKLTETSLRVQVINVSTGEYEGNVTIKLQE